MTIAEAQAASSARKPKRTTPSKTWKDSLRQACLEKARRRRRSRGAGAEDHHQEPLDVTDLPARAMVEDAMRQQGISVISPCMDYYHAGSDNDNNMLLSSPTLDRYATSTIDSPNATTNNVNDEPNNSSVQHFISEDELFELLEQVEQEIQKSDADHLEDMLRLAREEQEQLQDCVDEYEQWQQEEYDVGCTATRATVQVLCPVCKQANLSETFGSDCLSCPNNMDGSCSFCIAGRPGLTLETLCEQLRVSYEQHASYCHDTLCFQVVPVDQGSALLLAVCGVCETRMRVV